MRARHVIVWLALVTVLTLTIILDRPVSARQAGTTLTANLTATGQVGQGSSWEITKTITPDINLRIITPDFWELHWGDPDVHVGSSATVTYTIAVTRSGGPGESMIDGQICVTNGGGVATENLQIVDVIQYKLGSGKFEDYISGVVDLSARPVLNPGESYCYPYSMAFTPVAGAIYRNVARITITNHSGWLPGGNNCHGPDLCPFGPDPKADFSLPDSPDLGLASSTITVSDSNGGLWTFSDSGSVSYIETVTCGPSNPDDLIPLTNVAIILETGQSASTAVQVACVNITPD
jgi:hypothetical protein